MVLREIRGEKKSKPKILLPKGDKKVFGHVPPEACILNHKIQQSTFYMR